MDFIQKYVSSQNEIINTVIMEDSFVQIGARLRGLREVLEVPAQEVADLCDISLEQYEKIERGETDPSVSRLLKISKRYGIALDVLMFGEEPHMNGYFVTRKDKGMRVERRCDYRYQSLAAGFRMRNMDPFLVEVAPLPEGERRGQNSHDGQEFAMVLEGRLELTIENHCIVLEQGDSIYFDSTRPHCMHALDNKTVKFVSIVG